MQKQYHQRTTLCTWEPWRAQERDTEQLAPTIARLIYNASELLGTTVTQRYTSLGTDFEMHAIWQGYVEDPTAKDFVARKACTIALSEAWGTWQSTLFRSLETPLWTPCPSCTAYLSGAYVTQEGVSLRIFVIKKGMIHVRSMDVCTRNLWQKVERGKFTSSKSTTRFPRASCFEKPTRSVPETWGRMYNVPAWSAKTTRNGMRNRIPMQPRKAQIN
jgi:hypothetical protein